MVVEDAACISKNLRKGSMKPLMTETEEVAVRLVTALAEVNLRTTTEGKTLPRAKSVERRKITLWSVVT